MATQNFYRKIMENSAIVGVGLWMHFNGLSVLELNFYKLPVLEPNAASTVFIFSVLCILADLRPMWPRNIRRPVPLLQFFIDFCIILYGTDIILRQLWIPSLKLLNYICRYFGSYIVSVNDEMVVTTVPNASHWIKNDGFYILRFLLAVVAFIFMVEVTGVFENFFHKFRHPNLTPNELILLQTLENDDKANNEWNNNSQRTKLLAQRLVNDMNNF